MSVTFYARDPVKSTPAFGVYVEGVDGPTWANGTAIMFLDLIGFRDRELYGGRATVVEARAGLRKLDSAAHCWPSSESIRARIATFAEFLDAAEAANAVEIYWA